MSGSALSDCLSSYRAAHLSNEGGVHMWLAVEAGQSVQSVLIRRFTQMPNRQSLFSGPRYMDLRTNAI